MAAENSITCESVIASSSFPDVVTLLDAFHAGAATANLQLYFGCFHSQGRFLGTDASENWSVQEFFEFSKPYFLRGSGWTYVPRPETRKFTYFPVNDPALASSSSSPVFCTFDELLDSQDFHATSRGSGTCVFDPAQNRWLLAQYHLTFPIPNDLAKDFTQKIFQFESLVKQDKEASNAAAELLAEWDLNNNSNNNNKNQKKTTKKKK